MRNLGEILYRPLTPAEREFAEAHRAFVREMKRPDGPSNVARDRVVKAHMALLGSVEEKQKVAQ